MERGILDADAGAGVLGREDEAIEDGFATPFGAAFFTSQALAAVSTSALAVEGPSVDSAGVPARRVVPPRRFVRVDVPPVVFVLLCKAVDV